MRTVNAEAQAHLSSGKPTYFVDLWTITLRDGTVLRWSGGEVPVTWADKPYVLGPKIERGVLNYTAGLQVDVLRFTLYPEQTDFKAGTPASGPAPIVVVPPVGAVPLRQALLRGDFDGASIELGVGFGASPLAYRGSTQENEALRLTVGGIPVTVAGEEVIIGRAIGAVWPLLEVLTVFKGRLARPSGGAASVECEAKSILSLLDQPFPRNVYQPACGNLLYDAVCSLDRADFRAAGTVGSIYSNLEFGSGLSQANDWFRWGTLRFLTGGNAGRSYGVQGFISSGGRISLNRPPVAPLAVGDTFEVFAGCDKKLATCQSKFSNVVHFRGMPFIPQPATTL